MNCEHDVTENDVNKIVAKNVSVDSTDIDMKVIEKSLTDVQKQKEKSNGTQKNKHETRKSTKRTRDNSNDKNNKKRKRIIQRNDSESDGE